MFSLCNNICCSSLSCSAESPSVLGHHTVNWVMRDYLITKYCSTSKRALLKPFHCVIFLFPWIYHKNLASFARKRKKLILTLTECRSGQFLLSLSVWS